jgi:ABC-type transporter Mla MlaB component
MDTVALRVRPPLTRDDLPGLFSRTCALLEEASPGLVRCDVTGLPADAVSLDALARLCLATKRHGARLELHGDSPDLGAFLAFAGLRDVLA